MARIAVTGIPSHWHRSILGKKNFATLYRESTFEVSARRNLEHETRGILNTGNYLIGEATRAAIGAQPLQHIPLKWITGEDHDAWIDYINANFDMLVLAVANIFHTAFATSGEAALIDDLKLPVVIMSAGIQKRSEFGDTYPESFEPFIRALVDNKVCVLTRGPATAEFLSKQGVAFAEPIGCPSNYFRPANMRRALAAFKEVKLTDPIKISHNGYLGSVRDTIPDINQFGDPDIAYYTLQDEFLWFNYTFDCEPEERAYNDASGEILALTTFPGADQLQKTLSQRIFFNTDQWRAWLSTLDLSMGRRFHGNLIAGQAGVPFFMIPVDDRMDEMLAMTKYPSIPAAEWNQSGDRARVFADYVDSYDANAAIEAYNANVGRFHALLKRAGLR